MKKPSIILAVLILIASIAMHFYVNAKNNQSPYHFTLFVLLAGLQILRLGLAYSVRNKKFDQ